MPIYDFYCPICLYNFESIEKIGTEVTSCPCCRYGNVEKVFSGTRFVPFKPYVEENLGDKPVEIKSKKQLRQECNKVGADYI